MNMSFHELTDRPLFERLDALHACDPRSADALRLALELGQEPLRDQAQAPSIDEWLNRNAAVQQREMIISTGVPSATQCTSMMQNMHKRSVMFILERDPNRVLGLFRACPLERWIGEEKLILAIGDDVKTAKETFYRILDPHTTPDFQILDPGNGSIADYEYYHALLQELRDEVRREVFNAGTLVHLGPLWQFNTLQKLDTIVRNPGINALKDLFCDKPALVAAAGPSLTHALPILHACQGRFVLIATGTALRPLRHAGIRPDLVVAVDGSHLIGPQFATDCDDLFFACSSQVYSPPLSKFRGVFTGGLDVNPLDHWIDSHIGARGTIFARGTVTGSAMGLGMLMGCRPIVVVGLDLSFKDDGTTHADHTMYHRCAMRREALIKTSGNYRDTVLTTRQFECYIKLMEELVASHTETAFVNAINSGARIEGMQLTQPENLPDLAAPAFEPYAAIASAHAVSEPPDLNGFYNELALVTEQLQDKFMASREAASVCNRLIMALQSGAAGAERAREVLRTLEACEERMNHPSVADVFLKMSLWPAVYEMQTWQKDEEGPGADPRRRFRHLRDFYEQIGGAARWTRTAILQSPPAQQALHRRLSLKAPAIEQNNVTQENQVVYGGINNAKL